MSKIYSRDPLKHFGAFQSLGLFQIFKILIGHFDRVEKKTL